MFENISAANMLNSIVPISRFNKGEANKIFEEVKTSGFKIVVKNNKPACVLLKPEKYEEIMETLENYALFVEAERRMGSEGAGNFISHSEILKEFNITREELDSIEVGIE